MPEGDTIFRAARTLHRALAGRTITKFETVLPFLARVETDSGIISRTIDKIEAHGKWLLMFLSGDLILLTHMLMSGSWHIYRPGERWQRHPSHMRIAIHTDQFVAVCFNVQVAEFHTAASLARRGGLRDLGPSLLNPSFDEDEVAFRLLADSHREIGVALLDQSLLAGIGNVFKSEICFAAGVNPFRSVGSISTSEAKSLIGIARKFLLANVADLSGSTIATYNGFRRTTHQSQPEDRLWVYQRRGQPCRRCGTPIESQKQQPGARSTFWCPHCQPFELVLARSAG